MGEPFVINRAEEGRRKATVRRHIGNPSILGTFLPCVIGIMLVLLFHYRGHRLDPSRFAYSVFVWLGARWSMPGSIFSHGWLIPAASLYLAWRKREQIRAARKEISATGLAAVVAFLLLHVLGYQSMLPRLSLVAMIGLLWAVPFYWWGVHVARHLFFPALYLLFCVPFTFLSHLTFPLRIVASATAIRLLNGLGLPSVRVGTALHVNVAGGLAFDVADPCSGLKYMVAISALAALYGYVSHHSQWKRWLLFLLSVPLAVVGNVTRVLAIVFAGILFGQELAMSIYHNLSGYLVFGVVVILMIAGSARLNTARQRRET